MNLERTKQLIHGEIKRENPIESLVPVLESAIELVSLPDNDFRWSSWEDSDEAICEIRSQITTIQNGSIPERLSVAVLFPPTRPLQEVSLSSGWAEAFLKVAEN